MKYSGIIYQWNGIEVAFDHPLDYDEWFQDTHDVYALPLRNVLYSGTEKIHLSNSSLITSQHVMNITTVEDDNDIELKNLLSDGTITHGELFVLYISEIIQ